MLLLFNSVRLCYFACQKSCMASSKAGERNKQNWHSERVKRNRNLRKREEQEKEEKGTPKASYPDTKSATE